MIANDGAKSSTREDQKWEGLLILTLLKQQCLGLIFGY